MSKLEPRYEDDTHLLGDDERLVAHVGPVDVYVGSTYYSLIWDHPNQHKDVCDTGVLKNLSRYMELDGDLINSEVLAPYRDAIVAVLTMRGAT